MVGNIRPMEFPHGLDCTGNAVNNDGSPCEEGRPDKKSNSSSLRVRVDREQSERMLNTNRAEARRIIRTQLLSADRMLFYLAIPGGEFVGPSYNAARLMLLKGQNLTQYASQRRISTPYGAMSTYLLLAELVELAKTQKTTNNWWCEPIVSTKFGNKSIFLTFSLGMSAKNSAIPSTQNMSASAFAAQFMHLPNIIAFSPIQCF